MSEPAYTPAQQAYVDTHSKSAGNAFILTFLLGPLGLFYSSWVAALILLVIAVVGLGTMVVPVFCWLLSMVLAFTSVNKHNEQVKATALLMSQNAAAEPQQAKTQLKP